LKQALHKSTIPPSRIFVIKRLQQQHFDPIWHAHSEYQLFVVLKGTGTRFVGDSIKRFAPGELVFTGPNLPHLWRSDDMFFKKKQTVKVEGIVIYFNEHFLGDHLMEKEEMTVIKKLFVKSLRGLEFHGPQKLRVIELMETLASSEGIKSVLLLLQMLEILAETKDYHYISSTAYTNKIDEHETNRINIVYDYVLKNFRRKILLEELAEVLHMTPTSFSRYFTMKNNKSFSKFVSEIRIKHACKLLTESEESIGTICYDCGFNTLSNFNKQFMDIMKKEPRQYKKEFMSL